MKKLITLFSVALLGVSSSVNAQIITSQDFEGLTAPALPVGWTQTVAVGTPNDSVGWRSGNNTNFASQYFAPPAHTNFVGINDDLHAGANNSNSFLMSAPFSLASSLHPYVSFDLAYGAGTDGTVHEKLTLEVSTNGGTNWTVLQTVGGNTVSSWEKRYVDLTAYAGQTNVMVGFRYADSSGWEFGVGLDNVTIFTPPANDISFLNITPPARTPSAYALSGNVTFGGTVENMSYTPITSFGFTYQQGANAPVTTTITPTTAIAPYTTYTFTASAIPYTLPAATANAIPVNAWLSLTGDINAANDSTTTELGVPTFWPRKSIAVEEGTGTWCGWCVRGIVFMDSLWGLHSDKVSLVAVHNSTSDPMQVPAYDAYVSSHIGGFPSVIVDRREVWDPSDLITVYDNENNYFGYADVNLTAASLTGSTFSVTANVKPSINLNGDYRLALVLTEDSVHGTASGYAQHNYYSSASQNVPLVGQGVNYQTLPATIPAAQMYFKFVARAISNVPGNTSSLPATMNAGTNYTATLTGSINAAWNANHMRAVVLLIDNRPGPDSGAIMNSAHVGVTLGISNVSAGIQGFRMYPNPTTAATTVGFELNNASDVQVEVYDVMGRKVNVAANEKMTAGQHFVNVSTANLAAGIYTVKIQTENGSVSDRLSVVK